jgi:predicted RNase H-like HicB family nuclease
MNSDIILRMGKYTYVAQIIPAEEGGYIALFPSLPGCHTQGETLTEVIEMAKEVLAGFLLTLKENGLPIPREKRTVKNWHRIDVPLSVKVA